MSHYRHVVLFQFKADAPAAKVQAIVDAFRALPGKLPAVKAFEGGRRVVRVGDQGDREFLKRLVDEVDGGLEQPSLDLGFADL